MGTLTISPKKYGNLLAKTMPRIIANDRVELPQFPAHRVVAFLTEQKGLRPVDMTAVFGSRSVTSDVLSGKREFSKNHIRKLAEFFHLSPAVFF